MLAALLAAGIYFKWYDFIDQFNASQQIEARVSGEELSRAMAAELGKVSESESARRAFNTLAGFWNVPPVPESGNLRQSQWNGACCSGPGAPSV